MKVHPYLNFDGTAEEAFNFYRNVFGGEIKGMMKMKDAPDGDKLPAEEQELVMHVALPIGNDIFLMASDIIPSAGHKLQPGSQTYVLLDVESREEADRLYQGLSDGGAIEMEIQDVFWGAYYGSFTDKFGIRWMINFDKNAGC